MKGSHFLMYMLTALINTGKDTDNSALMLSKQLSESVKEKFAGLFG